MAVEDILQALEDQADNRVEAIKSEADQRVKEVKAEVERETARTRRMRLKKIEDAVRSEATAIVYTASLKAKNELIKVQEEVVEEAIRLAEKRLVELRKGEEYPRVLGVLLDECLEFIDGEVVLQVREDDRGLVEKMMAERQRPYRFSDAPLGDSGGLYASSPDGEIVVRNSFESRLDRARQKLRLEISNTLFRA